MGLLDNLCRLCTLELDRSLSDCIFVPENGHLLLMIEQCLPITVTEDDCYPNFVCRPCSIQLGISFDFQRKCVSAGKVFDEIMVAEENRNKEIALQLLLASVKQEVEDDVVCEEQSENCANANEILQDVKEESSSDSEAIDEFICYHCSEGFKTKPALRKHICAKHILKPKKKKTSEKLLFVKIPPKNAAEPNKPWACKLCSKSYAHKRCLSVHMKQHNDGIYTCDMCQRKFDKMSLLVGHIRIHTGEKPFPCTSCIRRFRTKEVLRLHLRRYHSVEKNFQCEECKKMFGTQFCLNAHVRIHRMNKKHFCESCETGFRTKNQLLIHVRRSHTGEKPYRCETCASAFRTNGELTVHKRTHTGERPYKCVVCLKMFKTAAHLTLHRRIHTGERPHGCGECGKRFYARSDLNKHMVTHTREKRFPCNQCGLKFAFKARLNDHKRSHSK